jgi:hypothetical protein
MNGRKERGREKEVSESLVNPWIVGKCKAQALSGKYHSLREHNSDHASRDYASQLATQGELRYDCRCLSTDMYL